jgi:DNA polymerase III epsilon subunit-like protein
MSKVQIIDIEHTGFTNAMPIQVAAIHINYDASIVDSASFELGKCNLQNFKPTVPIEHGASAVHHLFIEDLEQEPKALTSVVYQMMLADLNTCDYIIGHNVDTDIAALGLENIKPIDTLFMARKLLDTDSYSQSAVLLYFYGYEAKQDIIEAHNALADVNMCYKIFIMLLQTFADSQGKTIQELFPNWEAIYSFSEWCKVPNLVDYGNKHRGSTWIEMLKVDPGYVTWWRTKSDTPPNKYQEVAIKQAQEQLKQERLNKDKI